MIDALLAARQYYLVDNCIFCGKMLVVTNKKNKQCTDTNCGTLYFVKSSNSKIFFSLGNFDFSMSLDEHLCTTEIAEYSKGKVKYYQVDYPLIINKDNYLQKANRVKKLQVFM